STDVARRANLALSRAAAARTVDAVLRAGRGDVLLPEPVAAARARGCAVRRRLGLAVPDAGARGCAGHGPARDHGLQSGFGCPAATGAGKREDPLPRSPA